jgi:hypothetical protein
MIVLTLHRSALESMVLTIWDDIGDSVHVTDNEFPNAIVDSSWIFDFLTKHLQVPFDRINNDSAKIF